MFALSVHEDAEADLEDLYKRDQRTVLAIAALLEELSGSQELLDRLTDHDFGKNRKEEFHVSKWLEQWRKGHDLWRLKIWRLERHGIQYRIVYAFIPIKRQYIVLAIAPRDFDYDESHPITQRILRAYREL